MQVVLNVFPVIGETVRPFFFKRHVPTSLASINFQIFIIDFWEIPIRMSSLYIYPLLFVQFMIPQNSGFQGIEIYLANFLFEA